MKRIVLHCLLLAFVAGTVLITYASSASAAFNPGRIIDDNVFNNTASMSAAQIDAFLNRYPNSCISTNRGFSAPDTTGYSPSTSFTYGNNVSAGTVIAHAAQAYDINPQVLLATLQKEQSLVEGEAGCTVRRYTAAMGYGCPDSGGKYTYSGLNLYSIHGVTATSVNDTCVNSPAKAGFSQQVIRAAWVLKFAQQRSLGNVGWAIIRGSWDNSDDPQSCYSGPMTGGWHKVCPNGPTTFFDGYRTIDGQAIYMTTGAAASLYRYTPHLHGNQNFVAIWERWWGPSHSGTYIWKTTGYSILTKNESAYVDPGRLQPGEIYMAKLHAYNTGTATWLKNGPTPMVLGGWGPGSNFCLPGEWISCIRPTGMVEDSVAPGQLGHFKFRFRAPFRPGEYREEFKPLAEMLSWTNNAYGQQFGIKVNDPGTFRWSTTGYSILAEDNSQYVDPGNLQPNTVYLAKLHAYNTGTATWRNSGPTPVVLGGWAPGSDFCIPGQWIACNRPVKLHESSVAPGQLGHFIFKFKTPSTPGVYRQDFKPVAEMYSWTNDHQPQQIFGIIVR